MQNKKRLFIIFFLFLFVCLSLASFVLALEVEYPTFDNQQPDAKSVPATIKYIFNAFIVIALLAVIGSLVYGGVLYLTAAGDPSIHNKGKKQLVGSFIGLVILLGSYITLQFVNPELLSLSVQKVPIKSGILLLNEKAVSLTPAEIKKKIDTDLDKLLSETDQTQPQVRPLLSGGITNIATELGFKNPETNQVDFEPAGAYVFPSSFCQIYTYKGENFTDLLNYSYAYPQTNIYYGRGNIDVPVFNGVFKFEQAESIKSIQVVMGAPTGVQLAAVKDDQVSDKKFLYGVAWQQDLTDDISKNIEAKSIALRNWTPEKNATGFAMAPTHDYIAILYQGLSGYLSNIPSNFQIFFEHRKRKRISGGAFDDGTGNLPELVAYFTTITNNSFLNISQNNDMSKNTNKKYGVLKSYPMSMQVGEINENGSIDVWLCSRTQILAFETSPYCKHFGMAEYEPRDFKGGDVVLRLDGGVDTDKNGKCDNGELCEVLTNNVRSIFIKGKAIVVLFANSVDSSNFSENSEVFVSPGGSLNVPSLVGHKILNCTTEGVPLGNSMIESAVSPCAKGLAIYPVK